jgi:hypothetical protein
MGLAKVGEEGEARRGVKMHACHWDCPAAWLAVPSYNHCSRVRVGESGGVPSGSNLEGCEHHHIPETINVVSNSGSTISPA